MDLHIFRPSEFENHIFSVGLSVCVCVCYQDNSKTNFSRIFKIGILHLYHIQMLLETFYKDRKKNCVQEHTNYNTECMDSLWTEFHVCESSYI